MTISPETDDLETEGDLKAKESPVGPTLQPPVVTPSTPPPQLPHNDSITTSLEPVTTKKPLKCQLKCTVRLEILTKLDIIKHVHMHHEKDTLVETVETSKDTHYTRSSDKLKPTRTTRHPRSTTKDINYSILGIEDSDNVSPTPKHQ